MGEHLHGVIFNCVVWVEFKRVFLLSELVDFVEDFALSLTLLELLFLELLGVEHLGQQIVESGLIICLSFFGLFNFLFFLEFNGFVVLILSKGSLNIRQSLQHNFVSMLKTHSME